jgi:hypothetical protein
VATAGEARSAVFFAERTRLAFAERTRRRGRAAESAERSQFHNRRVLMLTALMKERYIATDIPWTGSGVCAANPNGGRSGF